MRAFIISHQEVKAYSACKPGVPLRSVLRRVQNIMNTLDGLVRVHKWNKICTRAFNMTSYAREGKLKMLDCIWSGDGDLTDDRINEALALKNVYDDLENTEAVERAVEKMDDLINILQGWTAIWRSLPDRPDWRKLADNGKWEELGQRYEWTVGVIDEEEESMDCGEGQVATPTPNRTWHAARSMLTGKRMLVAHSDPTQTGKPFREHFEFDPRARGPQDSRWVRWTADDGHQPLPSRPGTSQTRQLAIERAAVNEDCETLINRRTQTNEESFLNYTTYLSSPLSTRLEFPDDFERRIQCEMADAKHANHGVTCPCVHCVFQRPGGSFKEFNDNLERKISDAQDKRAELDRQIAERLKLLELLDELEQASGELFPSLSSTVPYPSSRYSQSLELPQVLGSPSPAESQTPLRNEAQEHTAHEPSQNTSRHDPADNGLRDFCFYPPTTTDRTPQPVLYPTLPTRSHPPPPPKLIIPPRNSSLENPAREDLAPATGGALYRRHWSEAYGHQELYSEEETFSPESYVHVSSMENLLEAEQGGMSKGKEPMYAEEPKETRFPPWGSSLRVEGEEDNVDDEKHFSCKPQATTETISHQHLTTESDRRPQGGVSPKAERLLDLKQALGDDPQGWTVINKNQSNADTEGDEISGRTEAGNSSKAVREKEKYKNLWKRSRAKLRAATELPGRSKPTGPVWEWVDEQKKDR